MTQRDEAPLALEGVPGEAGEAALRAALALSLVTQTPFRLDFETGTGMLTPAGLAALRAAAAVGGEAQGTAGAAQASFRPRTVRPGTFAVEAGPGTPTAPLLQMLALPLALAGGPSTVRLKGLTHGAGGPSFHELALGWLPTLETAGLACEPTLEEAGFTEESGAMAARVYPAPRLRPVELTSRGMLVDVRATALVANLGMGIAARLRQRASESLRRLGIAAQVEVLPLPAPRESRGLALLVAAQFERVRATVFAAGEAGRTAEAVADGAVAGFGALLERRGAVDGRTGVELLLAAALAASAHGAPGAIGGGGRGASRFTVTEVTPALLTVAPVIRAFLDVDVKVLGLPGSDGMIDVRPRSV
jgi:RNA 3'-terminal phosphate cyclase (ATP)